MSDTFGYDDPDHDGASDGEADAQAPQASPRGSGPPSQGVPQWIAGAFRAGEGLLGVLHNPPSAPPPQPGSLPPGYTPVGDGSVYMQDAAGHYALTPAYAQQVNGGDISGAPNLSRQAHNIFWPGVARDLATIGVGLLGGGPTAAEAGAVGVAGSGAAPGLRLTAKVGLAGAKALYKQQKANQRPDPQGPGQDRASSG